MAYSVDFASAFDSLPERKERLQKAFAEIDSKKASFSKIAANWKDVDEHFKEVEKNLRKTLEEYKAKEKAFEVKTKEVQADLDKREAEVSLKEQASLTRVQERKDAAVAAILEQKRKLAEERAARGVSEDAKKGNAPKKANGSVAQDKVADVKGASGNTALDFALSGLLAKELNEKDKAAAPKQDVKPRPPLKNLCENNNAEGLRTFIAKHKKELRQLSAELPAALRCASNPAELVLKALDAYYPHQKSNQAAKKGESVLTANRRACVILLEALSEVLADPILGAEHPVVPFDLKQSAKKLADSWKSKLNLEGNVDFNFALEAQSFLQLIATFGLASEYDQDELCKMVTKIARRKQTPALCRTLGLTEKVPDLIEKLINDGKQMDALSFASAFGLLERFEPVGLLKSYLREVRKAGQARNKTVAEQNEANQRELSALKAVMSAISEYKLEAEYPPATLEKRIVQLEKAKTDRKRAATPPQSGTPIKSATPITTQPLKRPRINDNLYSGAGAPGGAVMPEKPFIRQHDRAPYGAVGSSAYRSLGQPGFDNRPLGGYASAYGAGNRSPVGLPSSYLYPSDSLGSLGYGSSALGNTSSSYGTYNYVSALATAPSAYESYLR